MRIRELLAGLILAAGGILMALAALEVGVRVLHLVPGRFWEPDPVLGARLIANGSGWWTQEEREFLVPVKINQRGLHDVDHAYEKQDGITRILVLGDSFAEALHVPFDKGFPQVMQRKLNQLRPGGRQFEIINAGVSGYGTAGAVLYFEREGWRYSPDIVLLAFYAGNDVRNNSPTLEDAFRPVYDDQGTLLRIEPSRTGSGGAGGVWRSDAYRFLRQLVLVRQPAVGRALVSLGLMRPDALRAPTENDGVPTGFGMYEVPVGDEWRDAWRRTESLLERLRADVESHGARLMLALVTSRERVYPDTWQEIVQAHPAMQVRQWDLGQPEEWVGAWCARRSVSCLPMTTKFAATAKSGERPLHYRHDGHWTEAGHELGGSLIADFVAQSIAHSQTVSDFKVNSASTGSR